MELVKISTIEFKYSLMGAKYAGQNIGGSLDVFPAGTLLEVKIAVDLTNNKANMATTYWGDLNYDAPLPTPVSFTNSGWTFNGNTKFWFGGGPSATKRNKITVTKMTVWDGYLPLATVGTTPYPGEVLLGHSPVLVANYKMQDLGASGLADSSTTGTASFGASTAAPTWVANSPILQFTGASQYFTVPTLSIAQPSTLVRGSLSVSFWMQPIAPASSPSYLFRYKTSGTQDRFAIKITSSLQLQMCAWATCQTAFTVPGLSATTWTLITANWAFRTTTTSNINCYYSVYANGQLVKPEYISGLSSSVVAYALSDVVRFGSGYLGKLAAIKMYTPGSLQANLGTWCTSTTCGADLGATNPPTCLKPASCHPSCSQCTDDTDSGCLVCASGRYFSAGKCIACPTGSFLNGGGSCSNCISHCNVCTDGTSCSACTSAYSYIGGSCINCPANCDACSSSTICTLCFTGFYLHNGACGTGCPATTFPSGSSCAACPANCDTCSDGSTCTVCTSGYRKYNNQCYNPCPVTTWADSGTTCASCPSNCDICSDSSTCTTCSSGWKLYNSGCVNSCPATTYTSGSVCAACPNHCDTCSSPGTTCTGCSSGYYLHSGVCGTGCPATTYISGNVCAGCVSNCDVCPDSSTCTTCTSGFKKYNNQCYNPCPTTTYADSTTTCANCPTNCNVCSDASTCTTCSATWYLHNNGCVNSCPATTYLSGSTCASCPSHCDTCNSPGTSCAVCSSGYYWHSGTCSNSCPPTTFPSVSVCTACPANCDTCSDGSTCTVCTTGFKKYNNQCYNPCPITTYANSGTTCASCSSHCDSCSDASTCTVCSSGGYYLHNAACTNTCPTTTFPSGLVCGNCPGNCDVCSDSSTCTTCSSGYRKYNNQCYNPCPVTTYPATSTTCSGCESNCKTCSDSTTCSECITGFFLYQQDCYGSCPVTTYNVGTNCQDCSSHCEVCSDANTCNLCSTSYYLYSNKCYGSCPTKTFPVGTNCQDCSSHCDVCIDSNTCTTCTSGYYFYSQKCYEKCPSQAPYVSPTVAPYVCYQTCPTATPYSYQSQCYVKCPDQAPYASGYVCSSKNPNSAEEIAQIGNTAGSAANTALVVRNVASFSNPMPFMFGSLMKLLQYTRYQNVSHSERLEALFQTISDSPDFIPKPSMSNEMQGAFESHPLPYVFEKYEMSSNFMLNEGNDILGILTYLAIFATLWVMQKGIFYLRNLPMMRSFVIKARFFFQNYLLSEFYEMLGDVSFSAVLELKTLKVHDRYSRLSLTACLVCLFLGAILYLLNIWIVYSYQKRKAKRNQLAGEEGKKSMEKFSEKYEGVEILFNDFDDRSFVHQAALIFFVGRNIIFCAIIALMYLMPLFQSVLLLILDLCLVIYYLWKRSIKNRMDFIEQLTYELILLTVNVCFFIQALADSLESSSAGLIYRIGEVVIVLNTICKFLPFVFLGIKLAFALWEYFKLLKQVLKTEAAKKKKKTKRTIRKMTKQFSNNSNDSSSSFMASFQTSLKGSQGGLNSSFQESSHPLNIETSKHVDMNDSSAQMNLFRNRNSKKMSIVPIQFYKEDVMSSRRDFSGGNVSSLGRVAEGIEITEGTEEVSRKRKIKIIKKKNQGQVVPGPDLREML